VGAPAGLAVRYFSAAAAWAACSSRVMFRSKRSR
jgi:hypothetical protein